MGACLAASPALLTQRAEDLTAAADYLEQLGLQRAELTALAAAAPRLLCFRRAVPFPAAHASSAACADAASPLLQPAQLSLRPARPAEFARRRGQRRGSHTRLRAMPPRSVYEQLQPAVMYLEAAGIARPVLLRLLRTEPGILLAAVEDKVVTDRSAKLLRDAYDVQNVQRIEWALEVRCAPAHSLPCCAAGAVWAGEVGAGSATGIMRSIPVSSGCTC